MLLDFPKPPSPLWVKQGSEKHARSEKLFQRRSLVKFHLLEEQKTQKRFNVFVESQLLNIYGVLDFMLEQETCIFPVEIKTHGFKPIKGHILQLIAYGICASETFGKSFDKGFLAYRDQNKIFAIENKEEYLQNISEITVKIRKDAQKALLPNSPAKDNKCGQCEWYHYCNDR